MNHTSQDMYRALSASRQHTAIEPRTRTSAGFGAFLDAMRDQHRELQLRDASTAPPYRAEDWYWLLASLAARILENSRHASHLMGLGHDSDQVQTLFRSMAQGHQAQAADFAVKAALALSGWYADTLGPLAPREEVRHG